MEKFQNYFFCKNFENFYDTFATNISYFENNLFLISFMTTYKFYYLLSIILIMILSCYLLYHIFQTPITALKSYQKIKCKSFFTTHTSRSRRKRRRILGSIERCTTMLSNDESKRRWRLIMIDVLTTRD